MNKKQEIRKMIEYISDNSREFRREDNGTFYTEGFIKTTLHKDEIYFIIDFKKSTLKEVGYDVSGHNGDPYAYQEVARDWKEIYSIVDGLKAIMRGLLELELKKKDEDAIKKAQRDRVDARLKEFLETK